MASAAALNEPAAVNDAPPSSPAAPDPEDVTTKKRAPLRPKLEALQLVNSTHGLNYVHRSLPGYFKSIAKGQGHEAGDLARLLKLYERWQTRLYPYGDFPSFQKKLDKLGTTFDVRQKIRDMRDDVARNMHGTQAVEAEFAQDAEEDGNDGLVNNDNDNDVDMDVNVAPEEDDWLEDLDLYHDDDDDDENEPQKHQQDHPKKHTAADAADAASAPPPQPLAEREGAEIDDDLLDEFDM